MALAACWASRHCDFFQKGFPEESMTRGSKHFVAMICAISSAPKPAGVAGGDVQTGSFGCK